MIHNKFRYLLTLVALFAMTTGAWAQFSTASGEVSSKINTKKALKATISRTGSGDAYDLRYAVKRGGSDNAYLQYSTEVFNGGVGTGGGAVYWGIRFPAADLAAYDGQILTQVGVFMDSDGDYGWTYSGNYTVRVYQGGDTAPGTLVSEATEYLPGDMAWHDITLTTPVKIDATQDLWLTFYTPDIAYPMSGCTYTGNPNSDFLSLDGSTWEHATGYGLDYTWMIRGVAAPAEPQSYEAKVFDLPASWASDNTYISAADMPEDFVQITFDEAKALAVPDGTVALIYGFNGDKVKVIVYDNSGTYSYESESKSSRGDIIWLQTYYNAKICYPAIAVTWDAATKTGTFTQPASDVVLTPIYAPVAQWATESDVELLPTAAEGIFAGTTDPIIVEGTVAPGQGTVMYFATTDATMTAEQAAQANGWLSTVPTAEAYDDATTVYVWYYIAGADTPDGQEATDKNTFNDSEICATPITVNVLTDKFDIDFNAANGNTIDGENGKGTVTVKEGTAEPVDRTSEIGADHKLKKVKMESKVTINAKRGYKFRNIEAQFADKK